MSESDEDDLLASSMGSKASQYEERMKGQDTESDVDSEPERTEPEEEEEEEASHEKRGMGRLLASNARGYLANALRRDVNIITFAHACKGIKWQGDSKKLAAGTKDF